MLPTLSRLLVFANIHPSGPPSGLRHRTPAAPSPRERGNQMFRIEDLQANRCAAPGLEANPRIPAARVNLYLDCSKTLPSNSELPFGPPTFPSFWVTDSIISVRFGSGLPFTFKNCTSPSHLPTRAWARST